MAGRVLALDGRSAALRATQRRNSQPQTRKVPPVCTTYTTLRDPLRLRARWCGMFEFVRSSLGICLNADRRRGRNEKAPQLCHRATRSQFGVLFRAVAPASYCKAARRWPLPMLGINCEMVHSGGRCSRREENTTCCLRTSLSDRQSGA